MGFARAQPILRNSDKSALPLEAPARLQAVVSYSSRMWAAARLPLTLAAQASRDNAQSAR
jgi:hypothetical protein